MQAAAGASAAAPASRAIRSDASVPIAPTTGPPTICPPLSNMSLADSAVARTDGSIRPTIQPDTSGYSTGRSTETTR